MPPRPLHIFKHPLASSQLRPGTIIKGCRYKFSIPASTLSTYNQLQAPVRHWKTKVKMRSGIAPKEKTPPETQAWSENFLRAGLKRLGILRRLRLAFWYGYTISRQIRMCEELVLATNADWTMPVVLEHISNTTRKSSYPVPVPATVFSMIGSHLVDNVPGCLFVGLHLLDVAAAMGDRNASVRLCQWKLYNESHSYQVADYTRNVIANTAAKGTDWEAMTFHARHLHRAGKVSEALAMAMDVCRATERGPARLNEPTTSNLTPLPWKTWFDVLDYHDVQGKHLAWEYGAEVWDDPEACSKLAQSTHVREGSEQWLKYATKAAMAGKTRLMQDLGSYYLALHGWYPKNGQVSKAIDSKLGFAWLELSTEFLEPYQAAPVWAGMAMLLREHGDRSGGMDYLQAGIKQIEQKSVPQDEDTVAAETRKLCALEELRELVHAWKMETIAKHVDDRREHLILASRYLEPPIIPIPG